MCVGWFAVYIGDSWTTMVNSCLVISLAQLDSARSGAAIAILHENRCKTGWFCRYCRSILAQEHTPTHTQWTRVLSDVQLKVTDLSGRETIMRVTGGMKARVWRRLQHSWNWRRILAVLQEGLENEHRKWVSPSLITILNNIILSRWRQIVMSSGHLCGYVGRVWCDWLGQDSAQMESFPQYGFSDWNESWLGWPWWNSSETLLVFYFPKQNSYPWKLAFGRHSFICIFLGSFECFQGLKFKL